MESSLMTREGGHEYESEMTNRRQKLTESKNL